MVNSNREHVATFLNVSKGYMMETSTGAVSEGKMEPMNAQVPQEQLVVTGQYLYENFVVSGEEQITKMTMIRNLVDKAAALQIKGACDKMVEKAKEVDTANGIPDKIVKDGKEVANRGPKTQSAMNARTIIQQAWGSLKFAKSQLDALGYDEKTGYQDMRVLAKKALEAAKLDWKGEHAKTQADRERAALLRQQKGIQDVIAETQKANPMVVGESFMEYQVRIGQLAQGRAEKVRKENDAKAVETIVKGLVEKHDDNRLYLIAQALFDHLGLEVNKAEESETETEQEVEHA